MASAFIVTGTSSRFSDGSTAEIEVRDLARQRHLSGHKSAHSRCRRSTLRLMLHCHAFDGAAFRLRGRPLQGASIFSGNWRTFIRVTEFSLSRAIHTAKHRHGIQNWWWAIRSAYHGPLLASSSFIGVTELYLAGGYVRYLYGINAARPSQTRRVCGRS